MTTTRTWITRLAALGAVTALALTGCGGTDEPPSDPGTADGTAPSTPADDATGDDTDVEGVTITLVTHDSFNLSEDTLATFTDQTGVEVELLPSGDAGTMLNQTILTKDSPRADVLFGVDNTFLSRALDEELFRPYEAEGLDRVRDDLLVDPEHRVTPIDFGDVCLNYDIAWFDDEGLEVPGTLAELTEAAYEGLLVVENPATSSPGLAFLLATIEEFGEDGYLDFWADLRANDVLVSDGWEDAYYGQFSGGAGEGDRPLVVSYASSPPAEVIFADPRPDEAPTAVIPASCFRQIEFAGILATTEHPEAAELLIDFMLSDTFQADIPLNMFVFPAVEDVELPPEFIEFTTVPDDPYRTDFERIGENRDAWLEAWTSTVLR
jgi:thiamine transport system substrate-binding protein